MYIYDHISIYVCPVAAWDRWIGVDGWIGSIKLMKNRDLVVGGWGGIARMGEIPGLNSTCYHFG